MLIERCLNEKKATPYSNISKRCDLCLAEKLHIIKDLMDEEKQFVRCNYGKCQWCRDL